MEAVLKQSGYPLKILAENLGISRDTIHDKFKERNLSYDFIARVGELIRYNFDYEYPEVSNIAKMVSMTTKSIEKGIYLQVDPPKKSKKLS